MDNIYVYFLFFSFLFLLMAVYFKVANRYNIIDRPNDRSSHTLVTVRGGGILFPLAAFIYFIAFGFTYYWFLGGLLLISIVTFVDDIKEVDGKIKMVFQFVAMLMLFIDLGLFNLAIYIYVPLLIFAVAAINAWNFMDGINGITGGYSLLTLITLIYVNDRVVSFAPEGFLIAISLSLLVFIFYNFRSHARCFAGDVGSVSMGLIVVFLMIRLIVVSENLNYLLFILIYGFDTLTTVFFRVLRKEDILEPHRKHLYQYLANEKGMPHNNVSLLYIFVQLIINLLVISLTPHTTLAFIASLGTGLVLFIALRFKLEGKARLLSN